MGQEPQHALLVDAHHPCRPGHAAPLDQGTNDANAIRERETVHDRILLTAKHIGQPMICGFAQICKGWYADLVPEPRTPGQLVSALLEARGWDKQVLAVVLGIDNAGVTRLISGKKRMDAETAIVLSDVFGVPAERFMELQQAYDLATARFTMGADAGRANRAALLGQLPIAEMITRGWLHATNVRDIEAVESELARFFGVPTVSDIEVLPHAAKKTDVSAPVTPTQLAWIHRVKQVARDLVVAPYSRRAVERAIDLLGDLLLSEQEARKVPRILAEAGVRFVIVESLKSAKIDGVCCWLDDKSPVIGVSIRFDRIDNFWFVLRHELQHVLLGHGKNAIIVDAEMELAPTNATEDEKLANDAAADFCVPSKMMDEFIARKAPLISKRDMLGFSNTIRVHPGIVAGQIQRRTGRYDIFREYQVKVRSIVSAGAAVDGWGDVFPVSA